MRRRRNSIWSDQHVAVVNTIELLSYLPYRLERLSTELIELESELALYQYRRRSQARNVKLLVDDYDLAYISAKLSDVNNVIEMLSELKDQYNLLKLGILNAK